MPTQPIRTTGMLHLFPPYTSAIARCVQWQEDVARICCVYPYRVPMDAMSEALKDLDFDPGPVYMHLSAGRMIPELDAKLAGVCKPWFPVSTRRPKRRSRRRMLAYARQKARLKR